VAEMRFRVSPIPVGESSCYYNWLSTCSAGVVVALATDTVFFPRAFLNPVVSNSFLSFLPVSVLILGIITGSFRSCCQWRFPSRGIILSGLVLILFVEFRIESPF